MASNSSTVNNPVYKTATYTAVNGDFVVVTANTFTVNLPLSFVAPSYGSQNVYPATLANVVVGTTGPQAPSSVGQQYQTQTVIVRNNGSGTVTVKTTDGTTIDGIAGGTGAVLTQYRGIQLYQDSVGNWVTVEGVHT